MAADAVNASIASPEVLQGASGWTSGSGPWPLQTVFAGIAAEWSAWQYVVTFLLGLVAYDQGEPPFPGR